MLFLLNSILGDAPLFPIKRCLFCHFKGILALFVFYAIMQISTFMSKRVMSRQAEISLLRLCYC